MARALIGNNDDDHTMLKSAGFSDEASIFTITSFLPSDS